MIRKRVKQFSEKTMLKQDVARLNRKTAGIGGGVVMMRTFAAAMVACLAGFAMPAHADDS
jgi:hypothetical protein